MNIQPLSDYNEPKYPKRASYVRNPELLMAHVPKGWQMQKLVAGALAAFVIGGCVRSDTGKNGDKAKQEMSPTDQQGRKGKIKRNSNEPVSVAPLFVHGEGRGSTGGEADHGVFMTEAEARRIITEELSKEGIVFDEEGFIPEDLTIEQWTYAKSDPTENTKHADNESKVIQDLLHKELNAYGGEDISSYMEKEVDLDGYSAKLNLGFEFVSKDDYFDLGGLNSSATVQPYNMKAVAELLRIKLDKFGQINAVVFYDPVQIYSPNENESSEKNLRAQVHDFIAWAKEKGILKKVAK
jgi:hypothetical protein